MPVNPNKRRCTATTRHGLPCRKWAMRGHDVCRVHRRDLPPTKGAPIGNQRALKHGLQARVMSQGDLVAMAELGDSDCLDEEITYLRVVIRRLMMMLDQAESKDKVISWTGVLFDGISRLGSLLKARRSLAPEPESAEDERQKAMYAALDELSEELDIDL